MTSEIFNNIVGKIFVLPVTQDVQESRITVKTVKIIHKLRFYRSNNKSKYKHEIKKIYS